MAHYADNLLCLCAHGITGLRKMQLQIVPPLGTNASFGACCECGEEIAVARLESDPGAPFCADCQQAREQAR